MSEQAWVEEVAVKVRELATEKLAGTDHEFDSIQGLAVELAVKDILSEEA